MSDVTGKPGDYTGRIGERRILLIDAARTFYPGSSPWKYPSREEGVIVVATTGSVQSRRAGESVP